MNEITELAKMIDHSILHPTFTDEDLKRECELAVRYNTATVCVKPYHVSLATKYVEDSDVLTCAVIGFPHGNSKTDVKVYETLEAIKDGAIEIDMVVNTGKVLSKAWDYVETEISIINENCTDNGAILKVIFENDYLPDDEYKIKLCDICNRVNIAFAKTSTGYGFVKGPDGKYSYQGATFADLKLMRSHLKPTIQVKAAGGIRTLDDLLKVKELGVTRIGATATASILDEAINRFGSTGRIQLDRYLLNS